MTVKVLPLARNFSQWLGAVRRLSCASTQGRAMFICFAQSHCPHECGIEANFASTCRTINQPQVEFPKRSLTALPELFICRITMNYVDLPRVSHWISKKHMSPAPFHSKRASSLGAHSHDAFCEAWWKPQRRYKPTSVPTWRQTCIYHYPLFC